jgi:hypothetical protein
MFKDGVVNEFPVLREGPPEEFAYQLTVPDDGVAAKVTVPGVHRLDGVLLEISGYGVTVATTAVLAEVHPLLVAST